jgi:hypothetical protein
MVAGFFYLVLWGCLMDVLWNVGLSLAVIIGFRYLEHVLGFRWGPDTSREGQLREEVEGLRVRVADLQTQLDEALRRENIAHRQLQDVRVKLGAVEQELGELRANGHGAAKVVKERLLVAIGDDRQFAMDLAALRAVGRRTGLQYTRVRGVTRDLFAGHLDRARASGRPFRLVHLGVHGAEEGLVFGDGLVSWDWLSGVLNSVDVLVIASCNSSNVGDWLGVVPHVITMSEQLSMEDGARFGQLFWTEIGLGAPAQEALHSALERSPGHLIEHVVSHW